MSLRGDIDVFNAVLCVIASGLRVSVNSERAARLTRDVLDAIDRRSPAVPPEPLTAKAGLDEADCEGLPEEDGKYHHCPGCQLTPAAGTASTTVPRQDCLNSCLLVLSEKDWCGVCRGTRP